MNIPDGAGLIKGPVDLDGRSTRRRTRDGVVRAAIVKYSSGGEEWSRETR